MSRANKTVKRWSLQDAKNKLSAVVDAAAKGAPQIVTRRGVETAVIISYEEYERITSGRTHTPASLAQYLLDVPRVTEGEETIEPLELRPRDVDV